MALSGGVAPGYYLVLLQGTKNLPFGHTPRRRLSMTAVRKVGGFALVMLYFQKVIHSMGA